MRSIYLNEGYEVELRETPAPEPAAGEALIRVRAGGVCGTDMATYGGTHFLRRAPQVLGHEVAGEVVAVGAGVEAWSPGDRVFVNPVVWCGTCERCRAGAENLCRNLQLPGLDLPGLFSDLIAMPERTLHALPEGLSWVQGALIEPATVAYHAVSRAGLAPGCSVAVLGAGPIGALAAQICAETLAADVLVADVKPENLSLAGEAIACTTIDPSAESIADAAAAMTGGEGFDAVLVANSSQASLADAVPIVRAGGPIVAISASYEEPPRLDVARVVWNELALLGSFSFRPDEVDEVIGLVAGGMDVAALVGDRRAPAEAAETFAWLKQGGGRIKTVFEFD